MVIQYVCMPSPAKTAARFACGVFHVPFRMVAISQAGTCYKCAIIMLFFPYDYKHYPAKWIQMLSLADGQAHGWSGQLVSASMSVLAALTVPVDTLSICSITARSQQPLCP